MIYSEKKLTIIGVFYRGYKDLWYDFVHLFKKNWPDCPFDFIIVSDTEKEDYFEGVKVINAGENAEYSRKVQKIISSIDSDYYLLLLEDFFVGERVNTQTINQVFSYVVDNAIVYYAMPMKEFSNNYKGKRIGEKRRCISENGNYTISCQPAIWERSFLSKCIGTENYNAWIFEGIYSKSKKAHSSTFLSGCIADLSNPLNIHHGVLQGKMVPTTVIFLNNKGYVFCSQREQYPLKLYRVEQFKIFCRGLLPYRVQKGLRRIVRNKSVVNKYEERVKELIVLMELE